MKVKIENKAEENWNKVWEDLNEKTAEWNELSELILTILIKEISKVKDKKILEAGSGTGRISLRLAQKGARVTLLDTSPKAIEFSKKLFSKYNQNGVFVNNSIFNIPFPNETFDVVWNAGVLEHFLKEKQEIALKEMIRVCKKDGVIITLNPYQGAIFYRIGRWFLERKGQWQIDYEMPIKTLKNFSENNNFLVDKEYNIGFFESLNYMIHIPLISYLIRIILKIKNKLLGGKAFMLKNFGGYLLVTIIKKRL